MKGLPEERAVLLGRYIAENRATVRRAAKEFKVSKSTVHMVVINQNCLYGLSNRVVKPAPDCGCWPCYVIFLKSDAKSNKINIIIFICGRAFILTVYGIFE